MHDQADGAAGCAIRQTRKRRFTVLFERDGSDASTMDHRLVGVPGIEGGISGDVGGKALQCGDSTDVEGNKICDIPFVKGLSILGQDDIPVDRVGAGRNA